MFTSGEECGRKRQYHQFRENFEDCIIEKTKFLIKKTWKHCKKKLKIYSQTCIKRSPLGERKMALYDRWPLIRGSIHMKFSMTGQEKMTFIYRWLLNRVDHMDRFDCI